MCVCIPWRRLSFEHGSAALPCTIHSRPARITYTFPPPVCAGGLASSTKILCSVLHHALYSTHALTLQIRIDNKSLLQSHDTYASCQQSNKPMVYTAAAVYLSWLTLLGRRESCSTADFRRCRCGHQPQAPGRACTASRPRRQPRRPTRVCRAFSSLQSICWNLRVVKRPASRRSVMRGRYDRRMGRGLNTRKFVGVRTKQAALPGAGTDETLFQYR